MLQYGNPNIPRETKNITNDYLKAFEKYMDVLKMLSNASQEQYLKFFDDIEEMRKEGIKPDICSLDNLLYDPQQGFSFIDVYPGDERIKVKDIFHIILNNRFRAYYDFASMSVLPEEYKKTYSDYIDSIVSKIMFGLKEYGYPEDEVRHFLDRKEFVFSQDEIVKSEEIGIRFKNINDEYKKKGILELSI